MRIEDLNEIDVRVRIATMLYGGCCVIVDEDGGVAVLPDVGVTPTVEPAKPAPEEKESVDDIEKRARKPPSDGPCKGCGQNKPLNRLFLCYKCWVDKKNTEKGWKPGQPHPAGCGCDLDCRFDDKAAGN